MRARADDLLIRARRAKHDRKGLEAIFTSQTHVRNEEVLTGVIGIVAGLFLSILAAFPAEARQALGAWGQVIYSPLSFESIGVLLLICGTGTIMFVFTNRDTKLDNSMASSNDEHSGLDSRQGVEGLKERQMFGPGSKLGIVALIQGLVLVALYGGFAQEYDSNFTLQLWVRSNFPVGQSILNWESVMILSVCLGLLLLQFLPGRFFSE